MKKTVLLFSAIFLLTYTYAQRGLKLGAFVGPQLGYHMNADDSNLPEANYQARGVWGTTGGISVGYHFSDFFGIKVQAQYSQQGTAMDVTDTEGAVTRYTQQLDYFKIPLLIGFNTNPLGRKTALSFYVGPQYTSLVRALQLNDNPEKDLVPDPTLISRPGTFDLYTDNLFGLTSELGVDIQLSPEPIAFTIRLRQDFLFGDVENKEQTETYIENGQTRTQGFWQSLYPASNGTRNNTTTGLTTGLMFGIEYTFSN